MKIGGEMGVQCLVNFIAHRFEWQFWLAEDVLTLKVWLLLSQFYFFCIMNINISHCVLNNNLIWKVWWWMNKGNHQEKEDIFWRKQRISITSEGWWNDEEELKTMIDGVTTFFEVLCDKLIIKKNIVFCST